MLVNNTLINSNVNLSELERINKLSLQKLQELNEEKKKLINDEKNKFSEINLKCENFMNDFKSKIETSIPNMDTLVNENQTLKAKLDEAIKNANDLKESLESQMKEKDTHSQKVEVEIRNDIKNHLEEIVPYSS
jgi:hypothetical protein